MFSISLFIVFALYCDFSLKAFKEKSQYNAKTMNKEIENIININPEDYNWEYKRFKKQEVEDKSIYK